MYLFLIPLIVMILTQAIKIAIEGFKGDLNWRNVNNYGGMPSSHMALMASLVYTVGYYYGWTSGAEIVAIILLIIVLRDAVGFRRQLGLHAQLISKLIKDLPDKKEYKYPILDERLGHTVPQATVGLIVGAVLTYLITLFI